MTLASTLILETSNGHAMKTLLNVTHTKSSELPLYYGCFVE